MNSAPPGLQRQLKTILLSQSVVEPSTFSLEHFRKKIELIFPADWLPASGREDRLGAERCVPAEGAPEERAVCDEVGNWNIQIFLNLVLARKLL